MKYEVKCSMVQDLLPNYLENMTSGETDRIVEEHLSSCENCLLIHNQMKAEIESPKKLPVIELHFLKKVKRTKLIAAAVSIILALLASYMIYGSEYKYTIDKADLSHGITEYIKWVGDDIEAYVLETREIDGILIASFKDEERESVNGVAKFVRGMNQKYRIVQANIQSSEYQAVVEYYRLKLKDENYIAVSGYNLPSEVSQYALDFSTYTSPGYLSDHRVIQPVKFNVKNQQFLLILKESELTNLLMDTAEHEIYNHFLTGSSLYDLQGNEITEEYRLQDGDIEEIDHNIFKMELFMMNILIIIVLGFGAIMTRYFLTD
ncbi:zf-HC2 domain-containing protein [Proteiniclasticum sp.]|uniref:zf-HC2 domain-containing protein n=1 Tax=Proteiniclasticum sp. TaxID=2053595 RepID=UPI0028A1FC84|nr:zf-HC2 domain-containing protein [Proteiniclasticum sp.]